MQIVSVLSFQEHHGPHTHQALTRTETAGWLGEGNGVSQALNGL